MNYLPVLISVATVLSSPAIAGSVEPAMADPVIAPIAAAPAPVANWAGAYAGLSYSSVSGETEYFSLDLGPYDYEGGSVAGIFAGYNMQNGNLVYGGELSFTSGIGGLELFPNEAAGDIIEIRGRGGYAFGNALAYAFLGYGVSDYTISSSTWDVAGLSYGIGMDYMVTSNIFAGLEFSQRELTGDTHNPGQTQTSTLDAISLRAGYKF